MPLKKIRLELARTREFPEGSSEHGYEFTAPLRADGQLDADEWRTSRGKCKVHRFWRGEDDQRGMLIHRGQRWAFHYEDGDDEDEEAIFRFDRHHLVEGEYVSIIEPDGEQRTFRIVSVR
ncbi:MAG TPA: hypothetical protein VD978_15790 [Azospirillum sp.]|nr:hypothetical protein [Azospirillum sp.]